MLLGLSYVMNNCLFAGASIEEAFYAEHEAQFWLNSFALHSRALDTLDQGKLQPTLAESELIFLLPSYIALALLLVEWKFELHDDKAS